MPNDDEKKVSDKPEATETPKGPSVQEQIEQISREMLYLNPHLGYLPILMQTLSLHALAEEGGQQVVRPSPMVYEMAVKLRPGCTKNEAELYNVLRGVHERLANHPDPDVQGAMTWLEEEAL